MRTTLRSPCWLVIGVGVLMSLYFANDVNPSWTVVIGPLMLLLYLFLSLSVRSARQVSERATILVVTVVILCYGFWVYFDRTFVHFSTMDFSKIEVPLEQSV